MDFNGRPLNKNKIIEELLKILTFKEVNEIIQKDFFDFDCICGFGDILFDNIWVSLNDGTMKNFDKIVAVKRLQANYLNNVNEYHI